MNDTNVQTPSENPKLSKHDVGRCGHVEPKKCARNASKSMQWPDPAQEDVLALPPNFGSRETTVTPTERPVNQKKLNSNSRTAEK